LKVTITSDLPRSRVNERSACSFVAQYYTDSWVLTPPGAARYRIDSLDTCAEIVGWTTLTPATQNIIKVTGAQNAILCSSLPEERRQITVEATFDLPNTQYSSTHTWFIKNLVGQS